MGPTLHWPNLDIVHVTGLRSSINQVPYDLVMQTLGFEKYRRMINSSPQAMQESDFEHEPKMSWWSPVNVAIPPTAPSREDIMYQGPGGCIVGKSGMKVVRYKIS